jgi:tRNA A58 N-methylase Trm61
MGVNPVDTVADVGTGESFLSVRLTHAVGEQGQVYAEDINPAPRARPTRLLKWEG